MSTSRINLCRALVVGSLSAAVVAAGSVAAFASSEPTIKELMADCASGTGKCTFNDPVVKGAYLGDYHQVSNTLYNCSTSPATQSMDWSDSVGSTDTLETSITAGGKISGIVDLSVTAKYGHTWSTEHREGGSLGMTVKPGEVGWISRAQAMRQVYGTWQTHYDNPHWGHYYWYWHDTITSPAPNGTDGVTNAVVVKTRPMTDQEKKSCEVHGKRAFTSGVRVEKTVPKRPAPSSETPQPGDGRTPNSREEDTHHAS
ncbi:hypothetical protein ACIQU6_39715 [Streptomyces sp. NPDC090442]|uniref:hypothetical protein n=1 Tax=Streptomyces sp. NPDC090442 TaxID=3365962 RepID=UPI00380E184A